ncbi:MAG: YHYH protein [Ardenticatenales bacterium]|nr:YHYH protein [Ardenticatenales bacterium]
MKHSFVLLLALLLIACEPAPPSAPAGPTVPPTTPTPLMLPIGNVDLARLPLGDDRLSSAPTVGQLWPCRIDPNAGGAFTDGPWINADGTYDFLGKATVDGAVSWSPQFEVTLQGETRMIATNNLPPHTTGTYPISSSDDAYQTDRNPNTISEQEMRIELPATPTLAAQPSCVPGAIGVLLTGAVLFNALDAPGRDAVAHETQDGCQGHPQRSGVYHYHSVTTCLPDAPASGEHSPLMGYLLDGFGIYGRQGEEGAVLTSADLDECHGHTHAIAWDGQTVEMYHYHATWDFPYTAGCMRGTVNMQDMMTISGGHNFLE